MSCYVFAKLDFQMFVRVREVQAEVLQREPALCPEGLSGQKCLGNIITFYALFIEDPPHAWAGLGIGDLSVIIL